jgi:hypothetical protein
MSMHTPSIRFRNLLNHYIPHRTCKSVVILSWHVNHKFITDRRERDSLDSGNANTSPFLLTFEVKD